VYRPHAAALTSEISEEGRLFLAGLLTPLSDQQLRDLFEAARVNLRPRAP
jgi:hypothetical protein